MKSLFAFSALLLTASLSMSADFPTPFAHRLTTNNSTGDGNMTYYAEPTGSLPTFEFWNGSGIENMEPNESMMWVSGSWTGGIPNSTWIAGHFGIDTSWLATWTATNMASVATSGAYADLSGKPALSAVAASGSYADLTGRPTIPAAQVQSDWNAVSGLAMIQNKPSIPTNTNQLTNGAGFTTNTGTVTSVTAGTGLSGGTITGSGTISLPSIGTSGTYGIVATDAQGRVTSGKRQQAITGTADSSGNITVSFGTTYSVIPNIQQVILDNATNQYSRIVSRSTSGCVINCYSFVSNNLLGIISLTTTTAPINGAVVDLLITEK